VGVLFKCGNKLVIRESKTVVKRIIELDQSIEEPFINVCFENIEKISIPPSKVIWIL